MSTKTAFKPISPRQLSFLLKLAAERPTYAEAHDLNEARFKEFSGGFGGSASRTIDELLKVPAETKTPPAYTASPPKLCSAITAKPIKEMKISEDGMYRNPGNGEIFRVQVAKQGSGRLYAKRLDVTVRFNDRLDKYESRGHFVYAPGAVYNIEPAWKMTLDEAKAFGAMYGICCRCAAELTDETSIKEGVGPVCRGYFTGEKTTFVVS